MTVVSPRKARNFYAFAWRFLFLSAANPNWSRQNLEVMLQKHLNLTTGEVVGRLTGDLAADIRSYDEGHVHMLMFADTLTNGIAKQFPAKVGK